METTRFIQDLQKKFRYAQPYYNSSFQKYASKLWGVVWVEGVVKVISRWGLIKLHDTYFAYN